MNRRELLVSGASLGALALMPMAAEAFGKRPARPKRLLPLIPPLPPRSHGTLVMTASGNILVSEHSDVLCPPASLTKLMTMYLAFEQVRQGNLKLNTRLKVSPFAATQERNLGLIPGVSKPTVAEAAEAICVYSPNDMPVILAQKISGSEAAFVERMNQKALALGMQHTNFINASGLPDKKDPTRDRTQMTTAIDMALLTKALVEDFPEDKFRKLFKPHNFNGLPRHDGVMYSQEARHEKIEVVMDKTGHTDAAGWNIAIYSRIKAVEEPLITVILGADTPVQRVNQVWNLFHTGMDKLKEMLHIAADPNRPAAISGALKRLTP